MYAPCSLWIRAKSIVAEGTRTVKVGLMGRYSAEVWIVRQDVILLFF